MERTSLTLLCFSILFVATYTYANDKEEPTLAIPLNDSNKITSMAAPNAPTSVPTGINKGVRRGPVVTHEVRHDLSLPLSWMPTSFHRPKVIIERKNRRLPMKAGAPKTPPFDPVVQRSPFSPDVSVTPNIPSTAQNFEGISVTGYIPPDTNGDVGPNHYIQTVNVSYAIYSKSGGLLRGPDSITSIFSGLYPCDGEYGDPVVLYDQFADRWLISQFALPIDNWQCIAVSQTSDPTGAYYRYVYLWDDVVINDYPKFGVWPDGYYMSTNEFTCGLIDCTFEGAGAAAFERSQMLQGNSARMITFRAQPDGGQLPADADGNNPPPPGTPNYFADIEFYAVHLWAFHADWTNPANSTFAPKSLLNVAPFSLANDVPQPGPNPLLAAISDRLMYRLAYRNFGDHESLVVNHSVNVNGIAGVRWYEVRNASSPAPSIYQQGTYAPNDGVHRWMGSVAMDASGNIAAGYSVSNSTLYPSIRYTGRLSSDPLGTLPQGEQSIIAGRGSQDFFDRWGDYSSMSIDPTDDCTFWYTNEYYPLTSFFEWQTRIASFKFPSCGTGCSPPTNATNNTATDNNICATTGINITWPQDPGNWNDSAGTRTYDILRDGNAIASGLSYGTTAYTDLPGDSAIHTYVVRYNNGCGSSTTTVGASASDQGNLPPSGLINNTATDKSSCAADGINVTWAQDPGNWNDGGGARSYDVLRDGNVIASTLAYATTTYTDIPGDSVTHLYAVRYNNGCGFSATTQGASATDNNNVQSITQTANQSAPITAKNTIKAAQLQPAFSIAAGTATSGSITWSLTGPSLPYLTNCAIVRLRAPDGTEAALKNAGSANTGSADVLSFYNAEGPGFYTIVLEERAQCGTSKQSARIASTQMIVSQGGVCN